MDEPTYTPPTLLERIGWHPSDLAQIEVYAHMSPARKVELMLRWRGEQVRLLKERLMQEHPGCSREELSQMLQEHLDLVRESRNVG
jgi:hypothetical protein